MRNLLKEELESHPEKDLKILIISYITMMQKWILSLPITPGETEISMRDIMDDCARLLSHSTSRALSVIQVTHHHERDVTMAVGADGIRSTEGRKGVP